jgi:very-short-patch-repair endonuclease
MVRRRSQSIKGSDYSRDNISLEAFIRRLGEVEGKKEYLNYCNKLKKSLPNCVEYYLELGYDELQSAELVRKEQSKRLVSFGSASKESLRIFVSLYKYLRRLGLSRKEIWWGIGGSSEYFIKSKHRVCFYDFVIPKLKLIIEYNGSRYHPTKSTLKCEKKCRRIVGCKNIEDAKFKYKKDQQKLRIAKKNGFDVLVLWDTISTEENIAKVKKFVSKHV